MKACRLCQARGEQRVCCVVLCFQYPVCQSTRLDVKRRVATLGIWNNVWCCQGILKCGVITNILLRRILLLYFFRNLYLILKSLKLYIRKSHFTIFNVEFSAEHFLHRHFSKIRIPKTFFLLRDWFQKENLLGCKNKPRYSSNTITQLTIVFKNKLVRFLIFALATQ